MPYIDKNERTKVDDCIDELVTQLELHEKPYGLANYIITRIVAEGLKPESGWSYASLNAAHGTFISAANEFYRRLIAPYEDKAINVNTDIECYKE